MAANASERNVSIIIYEGNLDSDGEQNSEDDAEDYTRAREEDNGEEDNGELPDLVAFGY